MDLCACVLLLSILVDITGYKQFDLIDIFVYINMVLVYVYFMNGDSLLDRLCDGLCVCVAVSIARFILAIEKKKFK